MRHRLGREVPVGHFQVRQTQLGDDFSGKLPADGMSALNDGVDVQKFHGPKPFPGIGL
jgi:hypothetical protein